MSYQVIARKWRPQIFEDVIGQEAVTQTLRNAIEHDRLHHAYIFSGARGVGKTTTARILAKALNCHKTDKPNPTPCNTNDENVCPSCLEISESRSLDVLEFDAASNTQVDTIRQIIIENIQISAARDRYKVFIIDEVHMLSKSSFNALLKTLEEPPANVVFIMATTELHKVPDTILSRVQEFEFRTIPLPKILNRLKFIAEAEKIDISENALKEIARSGEGSMRDAQSNFDQVISFSGEKIDVEDVTKALGIAGVENLTRIIQAISDKNSTEVLKVVDDLISRGQDLRHFCTDLLSFIRDLLVFKMAGDAENLLDTAILSFDELSKFSEPFNEADLIRFFNSLAETESKLREANEPRYLLEVGLLKLLEMRKVQPIEQLLARLSTLESLLNNAEFSQTAATSNSVIENVIEKKTLNSEFPLEEVPFPTKSGESRAESREIETEIAEEIEEISESISPTIQQTSETYSESKANSLIIDVDAMPVKLEPISAEDLEHIEDKWLDERFEYQLLKSGDNLKILPNSQALIKSLLVQTTPTFSSEVSNPARTNGSATATARAKEIIAEITDSEEIDDTIPELPENPTEEQLFEYAQNHPTVKKVIKIFRGKLVNVKKIEK